MATLTSVSETTLSWCEQRDLRVVYQAETGSTNNDAKANALNENNDLVIYLCTHQTQGRGRGQNTWLDTGSGECLLSTWSMAASASPQAITGPRIGLALFRAANSVWPSLEWSLKAPNDLYLAGRKVGGLLVESVSSGSQFRLLIGLGMNVLNHPRRFQTAEHLSGSLAAAPEEGEWFQFLDELQREFQLAVSDCLRAELTPSVCTELAQALNANSARAFSVDKVTPNGDLIHSQGRVRWTDL